MHHLLVDIPPSFALWARLGTAAARAVAAVLAAADWIFAHFLRWSIRAGFECSVRHVRTSSMCTLVLLPTHTCLLMRYA